ncbi:YjbQ family protein [Candidatus Micrarchaeota archaeon]|nr:MAG: YjbQ family protein [Candidatus Micrarchaeota archaeon]
MIKEFRIRTTKSREVVDITNRVSECIKGVKEGICMVYVPHATAGLIINEFEPNIASDFVAFFEKLVPKAGWKHNVIDDNAEAHLKSGLVGPHALMPVSEGRLVLGTWQRIILCDFDGPRDRRVVVMVR